MPATAERYREVLLSAQRIDRASLARGDTAQRPLTDAEIGRMVERYAAKHGRPFVKADPAPIGPRRADEREYERRLRRRILDPLFRQLRSGLATAASEAQAIAILDGMPQPDGGDIPRAEAARHVRRLEGYHRARLISTFRSALAVDIRPLLVESGMREAMEARIAENVRLIKTIPQATPISLRHRVTQTFLDVPFDQQRLSAVLRDEFGAQGHTLRRITRDQTSKSIGQFTRIRHQQLGIREYKWRTKQDERVRPSHEALDGTTQRYDSPPSVGNPGEDIQCRCVPIPVIPEAMGGEREAE